MCSYGDYCISDIEKINFFFFYFPLGKKKRVQISEVKMRWTKKQKKNEHRIFFHFI